MNEPFHIGLTGERVTQGRDDLDRSGGTVTLIPQIGHHPLHLTHVDLVDPFHTAVVDTTTIEAFDQDRSFIAEADDLPAGGDETEPLRRPQAEVFVQVPIEEKRLYAVNAGARWGVAVSLGSATGVGGPGILRIVDICRRRASDVANGSGEPSATALVGMDGFVLVAQTVADGEHWLLVETAEPSRWCPGCGVAGVGNGRRRVLVRDLAIAGTPTVLVWAKRTFRCREELCERGSWSETSPLIAPRASLTERARAEICRRVGADLDTVAEAARAFGVGWACAHQAVIDHGDELIEADNRIDRTVAVGVDEHTFQHANARRRTQMATTFVDIDRARLLDVVTGRSGDVVRDWVTDRPDSWADQIQVATIDAFRGYATAIGDVLGDATLVIDHFHAIRLASACVDDVRRRVQQDTLGHRGHKGDPLYGIRRLLLRTWDHLTDTGWERLRAGLAAGDPNGDLAAVWLARELLVEVYAARNLAHARRRLIVFFQHAADAEIAELNRLARTIDTWRDEILAFHTTSGASNGPTEAVNLIIEKIRRIGHGYRNFTNYRRRLLLGCGITWTTVPTRRIRGRQPALAA